MSKSIDPVPQGTPLIDLDWSEWEEATGATSVPRKAPPREDRITMDDYGLELAAVVAKRAACTRRQVGAVIIGPDKRILATGYNGTAAGAKHCTDGGCPRGAFTHEQIPGLLGNGGHEVPCIALHAERNAIDWCVGNEISMEGATLFITCAPCPDCEEQAAAWGLRVVWPW